MGFNSITGTSIYPVPLRLVADPGLKDLFTFIIVVGEREIILLHSAVVAANRYPLVHSPQ